MIVNRGEIYLCRFTKGLGSEQGGSIRPVIVVQNNTGNQYSPTTIVAVITSQNKNKKNHIPTHVDISDSVGMHKPSMILCEQLITVDVKERLIRRIGFMDDMSLVNEALKISLGIE
jgi:mRNA interferase MazF